MESSLALISDWLDEENRYCRKKLSISSIIAGLAFAFCIYLDTHYDPPADFAYSLRGRGTLALIFLIVFSLQRLEFEAIGKLNFVIKKLAFALGILAAVAYQFQYSEDYANRARYLPPMIFGLGVFAARVGPSFTMLFSALYLIVMAYFNWRSPPHLQEDINHFTIATVGVFILQNRIRYEAIHFVSEWREKVRLAAAENEAKILASHAYGELTKLVYPHVVDLIQRGKLIEDTMPSGSARAAVLCLDVINSSTISDSRFPKAMEDFQGKFYEMMCENYDPAELFGNGYRIKDVGDGVYYSIGFPFQAPNGMNSAELAVTLAIRAIDVFHQIMGEIHADSAISCGIGVALGDVEGFFPSSGLQQYDLRGRAIVLASRYQAYRKQLRKLKLFGDGSSVLVISREVFTSLPDSQKSRFNEVNVSNVKLRIRNDIDAEFVYWLQIPSQSLGVGIAA